MTSRGRFDASGEPIPMTTKDPVIVVTGGNRGIGFEICRQLAGRGAQVVLTARQPEAGEEAVKDTAYMIAKVNHLNDRKAEGFLKALRAERPDLADGLVMMAPMLEISQRRSPWLSPQTWQEFLDRTLLFTDRLYVPFPPQVHDPVAQAEMKDERYMPREVVEALKKEGRWQEGEAVAKP